MVCELRHDFFFKTPLPFLAACLIAPFVRLRERKPRGEIFVILPLIVLLLSYSVLADRVNYGIRHILPVFPFLFLFAGRLGPFFATRSRRLRIAALAVLSLYPLSALLATPNTVDYFNLFARGQGDRILLDSNIDWGQGLKRVKSYMDREGLDHIDLSPTSATSTRPSTASAGTSPTPTGPAPSP
jgi:hypothetical protein